MKITQYHLPLETRTKHRYIEERLKKYCFRMVSNKLRGGDWGGGGVVEGGLKLVLLELNSRPLLLQRFETFGSHEGFQIHQ